MAVTDKMTDSVVPIPSDQDQAVLALDELTGVSMTFPFRPGQVDVGVVYCSVLLEEPRPEFNQIVNIGLGCRRDGDHR
jgi:hypothetical protein